MSKLQIEDTAISNTTTNLQMEIAKEIDNNPHTFLFLQVASNETYVRIA